MGSAWRSLHSTASFCSKQLWFKAVQVPRTNYFSRMWSHDGGDGRARGALTPAVCNGDTRRGGRWPSLDRLTPCGLPTNSNKK